MTRVLIGVSLLGMFLPSCSRKDSNPADAKTNASGATNSPAVQGSLAKTVGAKKLEEGTHKGSAGVVDVSVPKPEEVSPPYHQVYVLCVGVDSNLAYGPLRFAVSDAKGLAYILRHSYGFTNVTLLTNEGATRSNVLASLEDIRGRLSPKTNDDFIFYFSGHGETWPVSDVQDGKTNLSRCGFLVAYNEATNKTRTVAESKERNLEITVLASNIIQMPARHRLIFLDSCFSGLAYVKQDVVVKPPDDLNSEVINHPTVEIMTAGLDKEEALEDKSQEHGIFTAALLEQLKNDNILTMEEVFFPLRVAVRKSLQRLEGAPRMTPQLRYLIYQNGTFLFVPLNQLQAWSSTTSDNSDIAQANKKGYLHPVSVEEVTNVESAKTASPEERNDLVDRYETRAAMGDPCATIALAQIYTEVKPDPERAEVYKAESSDFMTAQKTLHFEALDGLTNAALQTIMGGLLRGFSYDNFFRARGLGLGKNPLGNLAAQQAVKNAPFGGIANFGKNVGNGFAGLFGKSSPVDDVEKRQQKVKELLTKRTGSYLTQAKEQLIACEKDLDKLAEKAPPDRLPPQVGQLRKLVQDAETALNQNLVDQAAANINKVGPLLQELQKTNKGQSGGK